MNRLLLTAAAVLSMAVSGQAMAVTYTLDNYDGALSAGGAPIMLGGVGDSFTSNVSNYTLGGFTFSRAIDFAQTEGTDDFSSLFMSSTFDGENGPEAMPAGQTGAYVMNAGGANSVLRITYDIGSIDALVGTDAVRFDVNVINTDADVGHYSYIDAYLDGAALPFDSWEITQSVALGDQPPTVRGFTVLGSALNSSSQLSFVLRGQNGYNTAIAPLTFQVSPVPELGLLPMFGTGLLAVGFVARRRRLTASL